MYIPDTNSEIITEKIRHMATGHNSVVLIMVGEKSKIDISSLILKLNENEINFFGGIFPGIIYDDQKFDDGLIAKALPAKERPIIVKELGKKNFQIPEFEDGRTKNTAQKMTAIILLDGLTANISLFLADIFNRLGSGVNYWGGGAGSLSLKQTPCVFNKDGIFQDAAVVALVDLKSKLGVRHGWQKIMGPFVATRTQKNIIAELNWRNAFDVYRETVESDSGKKITMDNFFDIAKAYPFGIYKEGAEDIVRDPIVVTANGELVCVGEIPENTVLHILKGNKASLIQAAGQAVDDCQNISGAQVSHCLVADCISRVLFLEDDFSQELSTVKNKMLSIHNTNIPEGMLTLGEISSIDEGFIEFLNKTIVTGILYE